MLTLYEVFKSFSNHLDGENKMNTKTISPFCDRKQRFWIFSKLFALAIAFLVWYDLQDGRFFLFS